MKLTNEIKIRRLSNGWLVEMPAPSKDPSNDLSGMMAVAAEFLPLIVNTLRGDDDDGDLFGTAGKNWSGSVPFEAKRPDLGKAVPLDELIGADSNSYIFAEFIDVLAFLQKSFQ